MVILIPWLMADRENINIYGIHVMHTWQELFFLNCVLQYEHFDIIIELGTYHGGLTCFFALNSAAKVVTFDVKDIPAYQRMYNILSKVLDITSYKMDAHDPATVSLVSDLIKGKRVLIYCDNGNKVLEFSLYAPLLKPNDVIMAHDRWQDIHETDIEKPVTVNHLQPFYQSEANKLGTSIFSFRRVE